MLLSANEILAITQPEGLFSGPDVIRNEYHDLIRAWHPDRNASPDASATMAHINELYALAQRKVVSGTWRKLGLLELPMTGGKIRRMKYMKRHEFELGEMVYGHEKIVYALKNDYADLFESAHRTISKLHYHDDKMRKEVSRFLPKINYRFETTDNRCILVMEKTRDVFCLRDVLNAAGGVLDQRHVGWILNGIYNIACYLNYAKLTHNDISLETLFISPEYHSVMLYGGWWYTAPIGAKMNALPHRTIDFAPSGIVRQKKADHRIDLTLIRALGRELLGDSTGHLLASNKTISKHVINYLKLPAGSVALQEYKSWREVLQSAFGKPRFVKMDIPESVIFKEVN